ncbi:MAG: S8 family serine peptidase [Phycisphaerae bacterium]
MKGHTGAATIRIIGSWFCGVARDTAKQVVVSMALGVGMMLVGFGCVPMSPDPDDTDIETPSDNPDDNNDIADARFQFDEDDDPEIAVLPFVQEELLARILPGADREDLDEAYAEIGVAALEELPEIQTVALGVDPDRFDAAATAISLNPLFESVHKSYLYDAEQIPDDTDFDRQSHFEPIGIDEAWEITTGSAEMIIAILDTGVDPDHVDLAPKLLEGWNVYDDNDDFDDVLGHGTAVAGTAAAVSDNRAGVSGVAWENPILPVRVSGPKGRAASRDIASGILWAVEHGAKVINVSFAPLGSDMTVLNAARFARDSGALVFISTGNKGKAYRSRKTDSAVFVGAVDDPDELATFSNTGPFVDLVAPGTHIYTTKRNQRYGNTSGTSFASPIVAGAAALVWSVNPDFRPVTVENLLMDTAVDLGDVGRDDSFGFGRIDVAAAVTQALDVVEVPDTRAPSVEIIYPATGDTVSGVVRVSVGAFDSVELADVVLFVDGEPFATDTSDPHMFAVHTRKLTAGTHTLTTVATDRAGNASTSKPVRITVVGGGSGSGGSSGNGGTQSDPSSSDTAGVAVVDESAPEIEFNFPAEGSRVFSSVGVQATVTDDESLRSAEWLVDGVRQQIVELEGTRQVITFLWNASSAANGRHRVTLRVQDQARNESSATLTVEKE